MTDAEHDRTSARVRSLLPRLNEIGDEDDLLDDLVSDCSAEKTLEINNCGKPAQLHYLLSAGWTPEDIINRARMAQEDRQKAVEQPE